MSWGLWCPDLLRSVWIGLASSWAKPGSPVTLCCSLVCLHLGYCTIGRQAVAFVTWEVTTSYPRSVSPVHCYHHLGLSMLAVRPMNFHTSTLSVKVCLLFSKLDSGLTSLAQPLPSSWLNVWPLRVCGGWHMSYPFLPRLYLVWYSLGVRNWYLLIKFILMLLAKQNQNPSENTLKLELRLLLMHQV